MTFLAAPPSARLASAGYPGERIFAEIGCASCHVRSLTTGASAVAALDHRRLQPYSDFLLHDMGSLGDGIVQGQATGTEMRTAPLWGLRLLTTFLHDGRARTVEQAILTSSSTDGVRERTRHLTACCRRRGRTPLRDTGNTPRRILRIDRRLAPWGT